MPETVVHFQIRMPPALHERLASHAREAKISLNALVVSMLVEANATRQGGRVDTTSSPSAAPLDVGTNGISPG